MKKCVTFIGYGNSQTMENDINDFLSKNAVTIISVTQSSAPVLNDIKTVVTIIYENIYVKQDTGPR
jgi:hypothetical protein